MARLKLLGNTMTIVLGIAGTAIALYILMISFYLLLFAGLFLFVYYVLSQQEDTEES